MFTVRGRCVCRCGPRRSDPSASRAGSSARRRASTFRASHRVCQSTRAGGPAQRPCCHHLTARRRPTAFARVVSSARGGHDVGLGGHDRAVAVRTAPQPLAPAHPHPPVPEPCVLQHMLAGRAAPREHPAAPAALQPLVGLDRQVQSQRVALRCQHTPPGYPNITAAGGQPSIQFISSRPLESAAWSLLSLEGFGPSPGQVRASGASPPPRSSPKTCNDQFIALPELLLVRAQTPA